MPYFIEVSLAIPVSLPLLFFSERRSSLPSQTGNSSQQCIVFQARSSEAPSHFLNPTCAVCQERARKVQGWQELFREDPTGIPLLQSSSQLAPGACTALSNKGYGSHVINNELSLKLRPDRRRIMQCVSSWGFHSSCTPLHLNQVRTCSVAGPQHEILFEVAQMQSLVAQERMF